MRIIYPFCQIHVYDHSTYSWISIALSINFFINYMVNWIVLAFNVSICSGVFEKYGRQDITHHYIPFQMLIINILIDFGLRLDASSGVNNVCVTLKLVSPYVCGGNARPYIHFLWPGILKPHKSLLLEPVPIVIF